MFQKQNSNVQVIFTGFDYCHVAAIVRPAIQANQDEPVHKANQSPNGSELPTVKPAVPHGSVDTSSVDISARPVADSPIHPTASSPKCLQSTSYRRIDLDQPGFLRLKDVLTILPISRAAWYSGIQSGRYPPSVSLGGRRSVGWPTSAIKTLIDELTTTQATTGSQQIKSKEEGDFTT
jgi:prophage regulatory protein